MAFGVYGAPQSGIEARIMVSLRHCLRQPQLTELRESVRRFRPSMGPGFAAPKREIVGISGLPAGRLLWLDHLVGDALALAIGHGVFLGIEAKAELLPHVAR